MAGIEDRREGTVVAPQHDSAHSAVALLEPEDVADRRAAEPVDRLVVVADHGQVPVRLREERDELRLGSVRVLEFVHEDVAEAALQGLPGTRRLAKQPQRE